MTKQFHSNGKLLLTGEYLVLHGAQALVLPLKFGQTLTVGTTDDDYLHWQAFEHGQEWFSAVFRLDNFSLVESTNVSTASRLKTFLTHIQDSKPELFRTGLDMVTNLDFDRAYGWGSSSTLVSLLAQWSGTDPYKLQFSFFGGSGYDVAAARQSFPFLYRRVNEIPRLTKTAFSPPFSKNLFFVYLGNKQNTNEEIRKYAARTAPSDKLLEKISAMTQKISLSEDLDEFEGLMEEHEKLLSAHLGRPALKQERFPDFPWTIKSLGAWGGDFAIFVLRGEKDFLDKYLKAKGIEVYYEYDRLIRHF